MTESVTITTGARLHFGLIVQGKPEQRTYGGIGLMVDQPGYALSVRSAERDHIVAAPDTTLRISEFLAKLRSAGAEGAWEVRVDSEIPAHAGLGSGTQLGMTIATAVSWLNDDLDAPLLELAKRVGRNARSAIGTIGFSVGGMIIDWGAPASGISESTFERLAFPQVWRFVLVTPPHEPGLSGAQELEAFRRLPSMTPKQVRQLRNYASSLQSALSRGSFSKRQRRCSSSVKSSVSTSHQFRTASMRMPAWPRSPIVCVLRASSAWDRQAGGRRCLRCVRANSRRNRSRGRSANQMASVIAMCASSMR